MAVDTTAEAAARPDTAPAADGPRDTVFDVGIHDPLPFGQLLTLGFQNIFGMIGMFVFPGIMGQALHLTAEQTAHLYGMSFVVSGFVTACQALLILKLPIVHGPYVGSFTALLALGQMPDAGLGLAFGSCFVACIIWLLMTVPIGSWSIAGLFARYLHHPLIAGMMVLFSMVQIANNTVPAWIGEKASPGFPNVNLLAGGVGVGVLVWCTLWGGRTLRRVAMLIALLVGTAFYSLFIPVSFGRVIASPWLVTPQFFPYGFSVRPDIVILFVLVLVPANIASMALYTVVGKWGHERLSPARMSGGLMSVAIGGMIASVLGAYTTYIYPDNVGLLRTTRVGSRYATLACGILLMLLGSCVKFDMMLVLVPTPVLAAIATVLFGIVMMHAIQHLSIVEWDDRNLIIAGFSLLLGMGGLFVAGEAYQALPLVARILLKQSVVIGGVPLIALHAILNRDRVAAGAARK
ncbi:MAG TPA: solute carrier family 23 protein [Micropepsaceae bacterium]|nr:solute carrier family 23 protein [Micropepsaceae bacterium]